VSVGAERVLTLRERNRALLERQLLLKRGKLSLPKALERIGGIQAQYAPSMYIGLWSRLQDFEFARLNQALERRTVVQGTLMRVTIHLVSAGDYWPIARAVREPRREWWIRYHRGKLSESDAVAAAEVVRKRLEEGKTARKDLIDGMDAAAFNGAGIWLDLVRIPPGGTWEHRRADVYALAEQWVGPAKGTAADGLRLLVERYLRGFGPAAPADVANWIGTAIKPVTAVLEEMDLRQLRGEDGKLLVDLPRLPLPSADTPAPVRLLPTWDSTLLAHARGTGILSEENRPRVFSTKTPQSVPTFLVDGEVAGTWRLDKAKVKLEPFARLSRDTRRELQDEADRLVAAASTE
jgi:hypothetical protein